MFPTGPVLVTPQPLNNPPKVPWSTKDVDSSGRRVVRCEGTVKIPDDTNVRHRIYFFFRSRPRTTNRPVSASRLTGVLMTTYFELSNVYPERALLLGVLSPCFTRLPLPFRNRTDPYLAEDDVIPIGARGLPYLQPGPAGVRTGLDGKHPISHVQPSNLGRAARSSDSTWLGSSGITHHHLTGPAAQERNGLRLSRDPTVSNTTP